MSISTVSAKEAKYKFGKLIDMARANPVVIEKHGRPVVVVVSVEEYTKLQGSSRNRALPHRHTEMLKTKSSNR
jgi:prevent-host-death family protein